MKFGMLLEDNDLKNIISEYELSSEIEDYDIESIKKVIAKYFSTKPEAVIKTDHGFIIVNNEEGD